MIISQEIATLKRGLKREISQAKSSHFNTCSGVSCDCGKPVQISFIFKLVMQIRCFD